MFVVVVKFGGLFGIIGLDFLVKYNVLIDVSNVILYLFYFGEVFLFREDCFYSRCVCVYLIEIVSVFGSSEMFV